LTEVSQACSHSIQANSQITLPVGVMTVSGFPQARILEKLKYRVFVFLTAFSSTARSRAVDEIGAHAWKDGSRTLLRSSGCCFDCVINQALIRSNRCYVIL
jgi:hypothetical protein